MAHSLPLDLSPERLTTLLTVGSIDQNDVLSKKRVKRLLRAPYMRAPWTPHLNDDIGHGWETNALRVPKGLGYLISPTTAYLIHQTVRQIRTSAQRAGIRELETFGKTQFFRAPNENGKEVLWIRALAARPYRIPPDGSIDQHRDPTGKREIQLNFVLGPEGERIYEIWPPSDQRPNTGGTILKVRPGGVWIQCERLDELGNGWKGERPWHQVHPAGGTGSVSILIVSVVEAPLEFLARYNRVENAAIKYGRTLLNIPTLSLEHSLSQ